MLFVSGAPGEGKSTLSFVMCRYLEQELSTYSTTSIKWFPLDDEHSAMRSLRNMARCCSMLAAAGDANYCRNVDEALRQRGGDGLDEKASWKTLIESRHTARSNQRLIILLGGIDQVAEGGFDTSLCFASPREGVELYSRV